MKDVLGLLGFLLYIAVILGIAASVTALVVKFSPAKKPKPDPDA
jgi:hypothetical protein